MSNSSNTIGYSKGSGPITARSIDRNQAQGGPVHGYGKPGTKVKEYAQGRIKPELGASNNEPKRAKR